MVNLILICTWAVVCCVGGRILLEHLAKAEKGKILHKQSIR
jgi:hypothetical protein